MDRLYELGYVTLEVADLDTAVDFYARAIRLDVTERRPDVVFMGGGKEHHWLRLEKSTTPGLSRVSYRAVDDAALEAIKVDLDQRSIAYTVGGDFALDRVDKWMRFTSPGGVPWELYTQMAELPTPVASNGVKMETLLHTLFAVPNFDEELIFCQEVLGFKISDKIENSIVFLRCGDGYHHSFGFARGPATLGKAQFKHFCILVPTLDDVMLYRHNAKELGIGIESDILKHPTSGSMGVYIKEPWHDFAIEFCVGHLRITDDDNYHWRNVSMGPGAIDVWKEPLPPPRVESKAPFYESLVDAAQDAL